MSSHMAATGSKLRGFHLTILASISGKKVFGWALEFCPIMIFAFRLCRFYRIIEFVPLLINLHSINLFEIF